VSYFSTEIFAFLSELSAHNEREWFLANKERYEKHVRTPTNASARHQHELRPGSLKRLPRGYAGDHPCAEDLKRTSFFAKASYTDDEVIAAEFIERFMAFLARALGMPW